MLSAVLALAGALVYGSADFLGGLAARKFRAILVTAIAATAGLVVLGAVLPIIGGQWLVADIWWGALSGITGAIAIGLLYACLAIGPMSVLSPVTAVVSAIAPMLWGIIVGGERLSTVGSIGLVVALVAIVLVAFLPGERVARPSMKGLAMATGSGLAIGAFLIIIDQTSAASGIVPLLMNRGVNALITGSIALALVVGAIRRGQNAAAALEVSVAGVAATPSGHADLEQHPAVRTLTRRSAFILAVACGVVDSAANVLLLLALRSGGDLSIVAALTALYPAGTVLLAAVVLRERIAALQWLGLALALLAGGMLAVG